jgi:hypothetical protein
MKIIKQSEYKFKTITSMFWVSQITGDSLINAVWFDFGKDVLPVKIRQIPFNYMIRN